MGDHSPEPVEETMLGNKFHCKNKYIRNTFCLFCLVMYLKVRWL